MMRKMFVLAGITVSLSANAQRAVSRIYSDFNGFWDSFSSVQPNNQHNLLGLPGMQMVRVQYIVR